MSFVEKADFFASRAMNQRRFFEHSGPNYQDFQVSNDEQKSGSLQSTGFAKNQSTEQLVLFFFSSVCVDCGEINCVVVFFTRADILSLSSKLK